jgi:hypothetical protein
MAMTSSARLRSAHRRRRHALRLIRLVAAAAVVGVLLHHALASSSPAALVGIVHDDDHAGLGTADGVVPDGVTVFDDRYPAVTRLDPDLLQALRSAAHDAARDGVEVEVNSGWRSPAYQQRLLEEAVAQYGSRAAAARWVATPATSEHVAGEAADVGADGATWLAAHGASYGLCPVYRNEPWHYELRPDAAEHGCPAPYADPAHDPRLQR